MNRKSILTASAVAVLALCGAANAQQKKDDKDAKVQIQGATCEEYLKQKLTDEQVKKLTDESRKAYLAQVKQCEESVAKNAKVINANKIIADSLKAGNDAYNAKNYDTAIAKYDEGYNADPEYIGSAPIFLSNKAAALRSRGVTRYNAAAQSKDAAGKAAAIKDLEASADALQKAVELYDKTPAATAAATAQSKSPQADRLGVIAQRYETYKVLLKMDASRAEQGVKAFQDYIAAENDSKKKQAAQESLAFAWFASGNLDNAATEYKKVVAVEPNNPDALYFLGTALIGNPEGDKAKISEGVGFLQRLVKNAPANYDQSKLADAQGLIESSTATAPTKSGTTKSGSGRKKN